MVWVVSLPAVTSWTKNDPKSTSLMASPPKSPSRIRVVRSSRGASVRRYAKPTFTRPAPADLRAEIAAECDVVIEALAD